MAIYAWLFGRLEKRNDNSRLQNIKRVKILSHREAIIHRVVFGILHGLLRLEMRSNDETRCSYNSRKVDDDCGIIWS